MTRVPSDPRLPSRPPRPWAVLLLAASAVGAGCIGAAPGGDVAVASYPAAFLVAELAGPDLEVVGVGPQGEAHHFEPSARDLSTLRSTPHLVLWTPALESWVAHARESLGPGAPATFEAMRLAAGETPLDGDDHAQEDGHGTSHDASFDPHSWLDPVAMAESARAVAAFLAGAYPEHADNITGRLAGLEERLDRLHTAFTDALQDCTHSLIVTNHDAHSYLASRYGFQILSLHGIAPGSEPSPATVQAAIEEIRGRGLPVLFIEEGTDARVVDALRDETKVQVRVLATLETQPAAGDYVDVQMQNVDALRVALACK